MASAQDETNIIRDAQARTDQFSQPEQLPIYTATNLSVHGAQSRADRSSQAERVSQLRARVQAIHLRRNPVEIQSQSGSMIAISAGQYDGQQVADPIHTRRLRHFLLLRLAIDYSMSEVFLFEEPLKRADWLTFIHIANKLRAIPVGHPFSMDNPDLGPEGCSYIWATVMAPAFTLGIPPDVVISLIRSYPITFDRMNGYDKWAYIRYHAWGIPALATKFLIDRHVLFEALTPTPTIKRALIEANTKATNRFFTVLIGPRDYVLTQSGADKLSRHNAQEVRRAPIYFEYWQIKAYGSSTCIAILQRMFRALPEEGKAKKNPGILERWARQTAKKFLGRDD